MRADWLHAAGWGVFTHYLTSPSMRAETWDRQVADFDVDGFVRQLTAIQAPYICLTLGQNSGHYCTPNATYDALVGITPSKLSRRDLVADLAAALAPHNIPLMVYLPAGAPDQDPVAIRQLEWSWGAYRNAEFQRKWYAIVREWSERWGDSICGWWIDGCYWPDVMYPEDEEPNFHTFAAAMRAGNPDSLVAFNPGVRAPGFFSDEDDYTAGEYNDAAAIECPGRWITGPHGERIQWQMLSFLGPTWGAAPPRFTPAQIVEITRNILTRQGVVTWDVPILPSGLIAEPFVEQLIALREGLAQPWDHLMYRAQIVKPPVLAESGALSGGRVRLSATNLGAAPISGVLEPVATPADVVTFARPGIPFTLAPGASAEVEISLEAHPAPGDEILVGARGSANPTPLPLRFGVTMPRIDAPTLAAVDAALSTVPARLMRNKGVTVAEVRMAHAGDALALAVRVTDHRIARGDRLWTGSVIEVFGSGPDETHIPAEIGQIFLLPTTDTPAGAYVQIRDPFNKGAGEQSPTEEIALACRPHAGGYDLTARIPLEYLRIDPSRDAFRVELMITAASEPGGPYLRTALFGSTSAPATNEAYGQVAIV